MKLPDPQLVNDIQSLQACVETCLAADAIAVDTEFMRTDTFFPLLGLIQICDGDQVWLVDPLPIDDFEALERLFSDPCVVKVFHSCSEDLEVLRHQLGLVPSPLFDTQTAAAFLGYGYSRGYSALMHEVLDIQLDKHETRSDWLKRPLSDSQLQYAAEDVYFLINAYRHLIAGLQAKGREQWMAEEMDELLAQALDVSGVEKYYLRVKSAWKLSLEQLGLLRELTSWREQEARLRNRPRNRIVPDKVLLDVVRFMPERVEGLRRIDGFQSGAVRRYGEKILDMLSAPVDLDDLEELPPPLDKDSRNVLADCRKIVEAQAQELGLAPELLARKKDLEVLVRSFMDQRPALPEPLSRGWREAVVGRILLERLGTPPPAAV